jgi:hypothetical protein
MNPYRAQDLARCAGNPWVVEDQRCPSRVEVKQ